MTPTHVPGAADLVIRGGTVVTGRDTIRAAVVVRDGRVSALCQDDAAPPADREFDASGKLVLPGAIDAHFHHRHLTLNREDFGEASLTAAYGGVTTLVAHIFGDETMTLKEYIQTGIEEGRGQSLLDFGLHLRIFIQDFKLYEQIPGAIALGAPSVKLTMGYRKRGRCISDDYLVAAMQQVNAGGGITMVHSENGIWIDYLEDKMRAAGQTKPGDFCRSRPPESEWDAINRVIAMNAALGGRVFFPHVTTRLGAESVRAARSRGELVYAETCPQYLLLTDEEMVRQGPMAKIGPPLRRSEDNEALWHAVADGSIQTIGSDHSPYLKADKQPGWENIFEALFGAPGIETLLPLTYSEGVAKARITLHQLVQVTAENPARVFGLYPRKGRIAVGADADLVVFDPDAEWEIHAAEQHSLSDYSLFEGWRVRGRPIASFLRGEPVLADGKVQRPRGSGQFIAGVLPAGRLLP